MKSLFAGRIVFVGALLVATVASAKDWYVDANYGNNEWDGSCKYADRDEGAGKGPKKWLSEAMLIPGLDADDVVHAAPGVYDEGEYWDGTNTNRVYVSKAIGLVADEGKDVTFIEGAVSSDHSSGNGAGAIRCVYLANASAYVRGFTIRKGRTAIQTGTSYWPYSGGGVKGGIVVDCVITNCSSGYRGVLGDGAAMYVIGCHVFAPEGKDPRNENYTSYGAVNYLNSIVHGTYAYSTSGAVHVNSIYPEGSPWQNSPAYNCYVYSVKTRTTYHHCQYVYYTPKDDDGVVLDDCKQVSVKEANLEAGSFRPLLGSSLIDAGVDEHYLTNFPAKVRALYADYAYGLEEPRFRGKAIDIGAYEYGGKRDLAAFLADNPHFRVTEEADGVSVYATGAELPDGDGFTATWSLPSGEILSNEFRIVATAGAGAALRIYLDDAAEATWLVLPSDGERTISYSAGVHTLRFVSEGGVSTVRSVSADVNIPWFVKPTGDDSADGRTFATARRTLKGAMGIPELAAGDVIYAAPGVYDEGEMWDSFNSNRVVVSGGVGLVGYAGADRTVIEGRYAAAAGDCGPESVRCAHVASNSFIRGFTLRHGSTSTTNGVTGNPHVYNWSGGNVFVGDYGAVIDCVVSNGVSYYRGGGCASMNSYGRASFIRCRISGNVGRVDTVAPGAFQGSYYGCVFDGSGATLYTTYGKTVNCVFRNSAQCKGNGTNYVYNTVLCSASGDGNQNEFHRCIIRQDSLNNRSSMHDGTLLGQTDIASMFGDDCRPLAGTLPEDFGNTDYYREQFPEEWIRFADRDIAGGQRVYNGAIDAGAGERDWRGDFAGKLARKGVEIPAADANVTTNAIAGLDLPAGESVTIRYLPAADGDCSLVLTGSAAVTLDGEVLTPAGGVYSFAAEAGKQYDLSVAAVSDVTVGSAGVPKRGAVLLFR